MVDFIQKLGFILTPRRRHERHALGPRTLYKQTDVTAANFKSVAPDVPQDPENNEPLRYEMGQLERGRNEEAVLTSCMFLSPFRDLVSAVDLSGPQRQSDHRASGRVALHDDRRAFEPRREPPLLSTRQRKDSRNQEYPYTYL